MRVKSTTDVQRPIVPVPEGASDGQLPFTGAPALAWLVLGIAFLAGGLLLRRGTAFAGKTVEFPSKPEPLAVLPDSPPRAPRLPSRRALVLSLLACGMLLFRRTR